MRNAGLITNEILDAFKAKNGPIANEAWCADVVRQAIIAARTEMREAVIAELRSKWIGHETVMHDIEAVLRALDPQGTE